MRANTWESLILWVVTVLSQICWAESPNEKPLSYAESSVSITAPKVKKKIDWEKLNLHFEQDFFYTNNTELFSRGSNQQMLKLGLDLKLQSSQKSHTLDLNYFYSEYEKEHYVNLREWNYTKNISENQKISVGRKLHDWSRADQVWQLGMWQPRFMWSRIRPEQNGLTGFFYNWSAEPFQIQAFASPIFVPEMGPRFSFRNGSFQSGNPWFKEPAKRATVEGFFENRDILYDLNMPPLQELVAQNSLALQGRWEQRDTFCQTSYAYKPVNGVFNSVDLLLRIDMPNAPPGVEVHPYTEYHRILSGECGYDAKNGVYGFVSLSQDNPLRQNLPENWISKRLQKATLASGLIGYRWSSHDVYFSTMSISGGDDLDTGTKASASESFFETWYDYVQAFRIGYSGKMAGWNQTEVQAAITWDSFQQGWSWTSGLQTGLTKTLEVFFRLDGVALAESSRSDGSSQFLNTFKTNDQASAGVYFVF